MSLPVNVGQELLNVPFADMIQQLALAIAEGQTALDLNSIEVATQLALTHLEPGSVVVAMEEEVNSEGDIIRSTPVFNPEPLSLLAFGLNPTFYQFTESIIEVKMEITMRQSRSASVTATAKTDVRTRTKQDYEVKGSVVGFAKVLFGVGGKATVSNTTTVAYSTSVTARYATTYSVKAQGSSLLRTTLKPVPPPDRSVPTVRVTAADNN